MMKFVEGLVDEIVRTENRLHVSIFPVVKSIEIIFNNSATTEKKKKKLRQFLLFIHFIWLYM